MTDISQFNMGVYRKRLCKCSNLVKKWNWLDHYVRNESQYARLGYFPLYINFFEILDTLVFTLHVFPLCMCSHSACVPTMHVFPPCMFSHTECVPTMHVFPPCMCSHSEFVPTLHLFPLYICSDSACVPTLYVFQLCMCSHSACVTTLHVFSLCMCSHSACVPSLQVFPLCMCSCGRSWYVRRGSQFDYNLKDIWVK